MARADQTEAALNGGNTRLLLSAAGCEFWWLSGVQSVFGGTTEIQKEILARRPHLAVAHRGHPRCAS